MKIAKTGLLALVLSALLFLGVIFSCSDNTPDLRQVVLDNNDGTGEANPRSIYYNSKDKKWYRDPSASTEIKRIGTPKREIQIEYKNSGTPQDVNWSLPEDKYMPIAFGGFTLEATGEMLINASGTINSDVNVKENTTAYAIWNVKSASKDQTSTSSNKITISLKTSTNDYFKGWQLVGKAEPFDKTLEQVEIDLDDPDIASYYENNKITLSATWGDSGYKTVTLNQNGATEYTLTELHYWNFNGKWYESQGMAEDKNIVELSSSLLPKKRVTVTYDVGNEKVNAPTPVLRTATFGGYKFDDADKTLFISSVGKITAGIVYKASSATAEWSTLEAITLPRADNLPGRPFQGWRIGDETIIRKAGSLYTIPEDNTEATIIAKGVWDDGTGADTNFTLTFDKLPVESEKPNSAIYRSGDTWYTADRDENGNLTLTTEYTDKVSIPTKSTTIKYDLNSDLSKNVVWPKGEMAEYQYEFKFGGYVDETDSTKYYVDAQGAFQKTATITKNSVAIPLWTASDVGIYGPTVALNGFKFVGWGLEAKTRNVVIGADNYYRPNKTTDKEFYEKLDAGTDITFYAIWTDERSFTLTLEATDEATSNRDSIKRYFKHIQQDNSDTVIKKWYSDSTFKTEVTSIPAASLPKKQWNVTFNAYNTEAGLLRDGSDRQLKSITRTADFTLEAYINTDPNFKGVKLESDGSLLLSNFNDYMTSDMTAVASYKSSGVSITVATVANIDQTSAQKQLYSFVGWSATPNGGDDNLPAFYIPKKPDTQFYALWKRVGIKELTFNSRYNDENLPTGSSGTYSIYFDVSTNKWYATSSGAFGPDGEKVITKITVPTNTWTLKYDVNFPDTNPPTSPSDETITIPFEGYGTYVDSEGNIISEGISEDIEGIKASWGTPSSVTLYSGFPETNGHAFVGWSTNGKEPVISTSVYTPDFTSFETNQIDHTAHTITLKGVWSSPYYTLKFNSSGENTAISYPALYYKDNKWYSTNNSGVLTNVFDPNTQTLLPKKEWTFRYETNSEYGNYYYTTTDKAVPISETLSFAFQGYKDNDGNVYVGDDGKLKVTSIDRDVVVTSSWSDNPTIKPLVMPTLKPDKYLTFDGWIYDSETVTNAGSEKLWAVDPFIPHKNGLVLYAVFKPSLYQLVGTYSSTTRTNSKGESITGYSIDSIDTNKTYIRRSTLNRKSYAFPTTVEGANGVKQIIYIGNVFNTVPNDDKQKYVNEIREPDTILDSATGVYKGLAALEKITLSKERRTIPQSLFEDCSKLTDINLPDGITTIGNFAFKGCSSLESIVIPETVTSIGASAFEGCTSLKSIVIPSKVTSIYNDVFKGCTSLESVVLSDNTVAIGVSSFEGCSVLSSINLVFSSSSLRIAAYAFRNCKALANVVLGDNITLTSTYTASNAFEGCEALLTAEIGKGFTRIPTGFFKGCKSLKSVSIPSTTTIIDSEAFSGCETLPSIELPATLKTISVNSFKDCKTLSDVSYKATYNNFIAITGINGADPTKNVDWCTGSQFRYVECTDYPYYVGKNGSVEFINASTQTSSTTQTESINIFRGTPIDETIKVNLKDGLVFVDDFVDKVLYIVAGDKTTIPQATGNDIKFTLNATKGKTYGSIKVSGTYDASLNYGAYKFGQLFNSNQVIKGYNVSFNPTIDFNIGSIITSTNTVSFQNLKEISEESKGYYFNVTINNAPGCTFRPLYGMSITSQVIEKAGLKAKIYAKDKATTATIYMYGTPKIGNDKEDYFKPVLVLTKKMLYGITKDVYTDNPNTGAAFIIENGTFIDSSLATYEFVSSGANSYYNIIKATDDSAYNPNVQDYIIPSTYGDATNGWWPIKTINRAHSGTAGFKGITNLRAIAFSKYSKLETIGSQTFYGSMLKSLTLPESLILIGDFALYYSKNLEYVYIGKKLIQFGNGNTDGDITGLCSNLRIIEVHKDNTVYEATTLTEEEKNQGKGTVLIHKQLKAIVSGGVNSTIPDGILVIGRRAYTRNITELTIPNTVTRIRYGALSSTKLTKLVIPDSVTTIDQDALANNTNLEDLTLPKSLTSLPSSLVAGCPKLLEIKYTGTMSEWTTLVGSNTSWRNTSLAYVNCADNKSFFLNTASGSISGTVYAFLGNKLATSNSTLTVTLNNGLMFKGQNGTSDFNNYQLSDDDVSISGNFYGSTTEKYKLSAKKHASTGTITLKTNTDVLANAGVGVRTITFQPLGSDVLRGDNITTRVQISGAEIKVYRFSTVGETVSIPSTNSFSGASGKYYITANIEGPTDDSVLFVSGSTSQSDLIRLNDEVHPLLSASVNRSSSTVAASKRSAKYALGRSGSGSLKEGEYTVRLYAPASMLGMKDWNGNILSLPRTVDESGVVTEEGARLIIDNGTPIDNEFFNLEFDASNNRYTVTTMKKAVDPDVKDYVIPSTMSDGTNGWWPVYALGTAGASEVFYSSSFGRRKLTAISFSKYSELKRINTNAFYDTAITTVSIPDSVTYIGQDAFNYSSVLESVYIGKNVSLFTSYTGDIFGNSPKLKTITIPSDSVNFRIENGCLITKSSGRLVFAPLGVTTIPNTVKTIAHGAFGCRSGLGANGVTFSNITIPKSVTKVETYPWGHVADTRLKTITYQGTMAEFYAINGYDNLYNTSYATNIVNVKCTDGNIFTRTVSITNDKDVYAVRGVEINSGNNRAKMIPNYGLEWATDDITEGWAITPKAGTYPQGLTFAYMSVKGDGKYIQVSGTPSASAEAKEYNVIIPNEYTDNGVKKKYFDADSITEFTAFTIKLYKITTTNHVTILSGAPTSSDDTKYVIKANIVGPSDANVKFNSSITSTAQVVASDSVSSNLQMTFGTVTNSGKTVDIFIRSSLSTSKFPTITAERQDYYPTIKLDVNTTSSKTLNIPNWTSQSFYSPKYTENSSGTVTSEGAIISHVKGDVLLDENYINYILETDGASYIASSLKQTLASSINYVIPPTVNGTSGWLPVTKIADRAFKANNQITSISLPREVVTIGDEAFCVATNLSTLKFASDAKLKYIGSQAFQQIKITELVIPSSVICLGNGTDEISTGYQGSFYYISTLEKVTFGSKSNIKQLRTNEFYNANKLKSITLPDGLTHLGSNDSSGQGPLANCTSLTQVVIPSTLKKIYKNVFANSTSLRLITFRGTKAQWDLVDKSTWEIPTNLAYVQCSDGTYYIKDSSNATVTISGNDIHAVRNVTKTGDASSNTVEAINTNNNTFKVTLGGGLYFLNVTDKTIPTVTGSSPTGLTYKLTAKSGESTGTITVSGNLTNADDESYTKVFNPQFVFNSTSTKEIQGVDITNLQSAASVKVKCYKFVLDHPTITVTSGTALPSDSADYALTFKITGPDQAVYFSTTPVVDFVPSDSITTTVVTDTKVDASTFKRQYNGTVNTVTSVTVYNTYAKVSVGGLGSTGSVIVPNWDTNTRVFFTDTKTSGITINPLSST